MTSYFPFTDTIFNVVECKVSQSKCVKGNLDPVNINGPWTFIREPARLRHYVTETVTSKILVNNGTLRYDSKIKKYYDHSLALVLNENVINFYNELVANGLLLDSLNNKITKPWSWKADRCSISRKGNQVLKSNSGEPDLVLSSDTCESVTEGGKRKRRTEVRQTRKTKPRRVRRVRNTHRR